MYERDEIHPGLLALPAGNGREAQQQLAAAAIEWVVQAAGEAGESTADFMVNKLVEVADDGTCTVGDLPEP